MRNSPASISDINSSIRLCRFTVQQVSLAIANKVAADDYLASLDEADPRRTEALLSQAASNDAAQSAAYGVAIPTMHVILNEMLDRKYPLSKATSR